MRAVFELFKAHMPDIPHHFGERNLSVKKAPPRVVWVMDSDQFDGPRQTSRNPKVKREVTTTVELHLWAADDDATEALRDRYVLACIDITGQAHGLLGGAWVPDGGWSTRGSAYVLRVTFTRTIDRATVQATINEVEHDVESF